MIFPIAPNSEHHPYSLSLQSDELIALYCELETFLPIKTTVTKSVKRWVKIMAHRNGWTSIKFSGKNCVLIADVQNHN